MEFAYNVPASYVEALNMQIGQTCGLCAASYVLNALSTTPVTTTPDLKTKEDVLVTAALVHTPAGWPRNLTLIGEILHPAEFAAFLNSQGGVTATHEIFDITRIKDVIDADGYVLVPFGVSGGFPAASGGGPHWCTIAGYREEAGKIYFLSKHWAKNYDFDSVALRISNASLLGFSQTIYSVGGPNVVTAHYSAHPSTSYNPATREYTFPPTELNASHNLEGQMITIS